MKKIKLFCQKVRSQRLTFYSQKNRFVALRNFTLSLFFFLRQSTVRFDVESSKSSDVESSDVESSIKQ